MRERLRVLDSSLVSYSRDYYVTRYMEKPAKEGDPPVEKEVRREEERKRGY